jgi:glycosyltransferase 2 family protein
VAASGERGSRRGALAQTPTGAGAGARDVPLTIAARISGWLADVAEQVASVSLPLLVLALALQAGQTLLNAMAWWNILRAAYPDSPPAFRKVLGAYAGGVALNVVLPAQGGTVAMLAMYRRQIQRSTVLGVLGAALVQSLFFIVVSVAVWGGLAVRRPDVFNVKLAWVRDHPVLVLIAALVVAVAAVAAGRRFQTRWAAVAEGGAILRTPRRYARGVLALQLAAYLLRMGVFATFMRAYGIPVTIGTVLLLMGVSAASSTFAATPGGVGTQQALASVALRDTASSQTIAGYSLGQQVIVGAWDLAVGLVLLWSTIGLAATRDVARRRVR